MKRVLICVALGAWVCSGFAMSAWDLYMQLLAEKARAEKGVVFTYGMPEVWANYGKIFARIKELYEITQQDIDMGSPVVLARMTEEKASKNDLADAKTGFAVTLASRGLTSDYCVSCWDALPEWARGIDPHTGSVWYAAYWGAIGFLVNVDLVKNVPQSWADLLTYAQEYQGLVEYSDPRSTGTGITIVQAIAYAVSGDPYDYVAGVEFLKKLHDAGVIGAVAPLVTVARWQRGEIAILINFDYNLLKWKEENPEINSVVVIPADGTVSMSNAVIMAKNAPHPYTARLVLEFILCGEGQKLFAEGFAHPVNTKVSIPSEIAAKFPPKEAYQNVVFVDAVKQRELSPALIDYYSKVIFGG
ncbi:MAG: extracellular solute-binding protein [Candidatus Bathyarchaeia archaeon]